MQTNPLLPLLQMPLPPLHADGLGWDELLPGGLAVLIGIGVYMVITGGGSDGNGSGQGIKRPRRRNQQR